MQLSAPIHQLKRRAKVLARHENIPLHAALDRIACQEGFARWSLLASRVTPQGGPDGLLAELAEGDLVLLAARPGHGKTMQGLSLLFEAVRMNRRAVFYTLEYTAPEAHDRLMHLCGGDTAAVQQIEVETSEDISADFIARHLADAARGSVAVVDYLQLLDQQRQKPDLAVQLRQMKHFAQARGLILVFISQIDRSFAATPSGMPGLSDIRMPNPVPQWLFSKACFLHNGARQMQRL